MLLSAWLREHEKTDGWLAAEIGRDRSFVTKLKNGLASPSLNTALLIERATAGAVTARDLERRREDTSAQADAA